MAVDLTNRIHADFSSGSGAWMGYRGDITGEYITGEGTGVNYVTYSNKLIREYNEKISELNQPTSLYIEPNDAGFRYTNNPLLTLYTGAVGAYSTRTVGFGGALMRIRRNSDNSELDIRGDKSGDISLSSPTIPSSSGSLGSFVDTASGYCTAWYDQSSTGSAQNNMISATASAQPMLVSGGSLLTENGKATLRGDGDSQMHGASTIFLEDDMAFAAVGTFNVANNNGMMMGETLTNPTGRSYFWLMNTTATITIRNNIENGFGQFTITDPRGDSKLWFLRREGTGVGFSVNGVEQTKTEAATRGEPFGVNRLFGAYADGYDLKGSIQEIILYNADQTANLTGIEANINSHYNLY